MQLPHELILEVAEAQLKAERTKAAIEELNALVEAIGHTVEERVRQATSDAARTTPDVDTKARPPEERGKRQGPPLAPSQGEGRQISFPELRR
jgi:hypothetical protein